MNEPIYFQGFLLTSALLVVEHAALYAMLNPRPADSAAIADRKVLAKFFLGVAAILAGCAFVRWQLPSADALITPAVCSLGGVVVALGYALRWFVERVKDAAYRRGRLHGMADKADIEESHGGR